MRAEVEAEEDARAKETCERSARAVAIPKPRGLAVASANIPAPQKSGADGEGDSGAEMRAPGAARD